VKIVPLGAPGLGNVKGDLEVIYLHEKSFLDDNKYISHYKQLFFKSMPKTVSICIPAYEYGGKGVSFLKTLFRSIQSQTLHDYEVIISDHSTNDDIRCLCEKNQKLDIKYFRNDYNRGSIAANTNFAIENANGRIIKIIYQDDFFINKNALKLIVEFFDQNDFQWVAHGFAHAKNRWSVRRKMTPKWTKNLLIGENLLGSPSCIAMRNSAKLYMDENLQLLVDTELYYRLQLTHGLPGIIPEILIANREHSSRTSSSGIDYNYEIKTNDGVWKLDKKELDYVLEKHKETFSFKQD